MQNHNSKPKMELKDRAYGYSIQIVKFLDSLPKDSSTQILAKQLLKSANESLYWLGLLKDAKSIDGAQMDSLLQETRELANILGASILTLKGKR